MMCNLRLSIIREPIRLFMKSFLCLQLAAVLLLLPSVTSFAQSGQARIATGAYHSMVLDEHGDVYTFGAGVWGELGHGPDKRMDIARLIEDPLLTGKTIVDIAISKTHMLLLTSEGVILGAGDNNQFAMGSPDVSNYTSLRVITHAALDTATIIQVYAGEGFSFLISDKGTVFTMGFNLNGFLGTGITTSPILNPTPLNLNSLNPGEKIIKMSTSISSRIFLTDQNNIYVTGENSSGQLGDGTYIGKTIVVPLSMHHFDGKTIKDINAAQGVHRIVTTDGSLYTLGNFRAAHGMGLVTADLMAPTLVTHPSLDGKAVSTVATMPSIYERTMLTTTDGLVYVAGQQGSGELGTGNFANTDTAWTQIPASFFDNKAVVEVVTGDRFSLFRTSDGMVYGAGRNAGTGYSGFLTRPFPINTTLLQGKTVTKMVASAVEQALLLTSDGEVFMINTRKSTLDIFNSINRYSILDRNTVKAVPTKLTHPNLSGHSIVDVKAGGAMSYLLTSEGKVFSFGRAATGALGLGDSLDVYVPTLITHPNLDGVKIVDIAIGSISGQEAIEIAHALLLTDDGNLFAMGSNNAGQLGVGDQNNRHVPTPVTTNLGGKTIVKIAAGPHNSMAIASDGTVFLWGRGTSDLMGFGNTNDLLVPTLASHINVGGKKIIDGAIGHTTRDFTANSDPHFLFLNEDNEVYGLGTNARGVLGLGNTTTPMITPQPLSTTNLTGETIVALEAGYRSSQLRTESGKLFGWGRAQMVGFPVSSFTNYSTPTLVVSTDLDNRKVIAVRHGHFHGLAMLEDGSVLSFGNYSDAGYEAYGASGLGFINEGTLAADYLRSQTPTRIPNFSTYVSPVPTGNLALHLDAERMGFIRSGDLVNTWQNLANNDHHAVNPAPELRPTRVASAINDRSAMRFNGIDQYFVLPSTTNLGIQNNDYELFMVAQTATSNSNLTFLLSAAIEQMELHANGGIGVRYIPNAGNYVDAGSTGDFTNGAPHLFNLRASDSEGVLAMNRGVVSVNAGNARTGTGNAIPMGVRQGGDFYLNGDIAEVIIYNKVLSESERAQVEDYLITKYNLPNQIQASLTLTGTEGWRLLASPVAGSTVGSVLDHIWTQGFDGANVSHGTPNVYTWATGDGTKNQANWTAAVNATDPMAPGQGMLVYVFRDDQGPGEPEGSFPKVINLDGTEPVGEQNLSARINTNVNGWTLLGNPFRHDILWNGITRSALSNAVYVYDANSSAWRTWNGTTGTLTDGRIGAFNAFFVETLDESPELRIDSGSKTFETGSFLGKSAGQDALSFSLQATHEGGLSNSSWFAFSEDSQSGLDPNDAHQLVSLGSSYVMLASVLDDSTHLDINSLPLLADITEIPVHLATTESGRFSITMADVTLPGDWSVTLTDTHTGATSDLEQPYHFTVDQPVAKSAPQDPLRTDFPLMSAQAQTGAPRFVVTIRPGTTTSIEDYTLPTEVALGQNYPNPFNPTTTIAYALPETAPVRLDVFDMLGRRVATLVNNEAHAPGSHAVSFDASRLTSGVYVYRLQAGSTVITRKFTLLK
jgi:alpha-tubulin suppressor-like RCC1 family protein